MISLNFWPKINLPLRATFSKVEKYLVNDWVTCFSKRLKNHFRTENSSSRVRNLNTLKKFPLGIQEIRTGLHHLIINYEKHIARVNDSRLYVTLRSIETVKIYILFLKIFAPKFAKKHYQWPSIIILFAKQNC